jgi:hypothetical protein
MQVVYIISGPVGFLIRRSRGEPPKGPPEPIEKPPEQTGEKA